MEVTKKQAVIERDGKEIVAIRIGAVGFGCTIDEFGLGTVDAILEKQGAEIISIAPSKSVKTFVGTWTGGEMDEIIYNFKGKKWYLYAIASCMEDTWQQEWWTSDRPLDANEAADAIEKSRRIAYPFMYK